MSSPCYMAGINCPYADVDLLLTAAEEDCTILTLPSGAALWLPKVQSVIELIKNCESTSEDDLSRLDTLQRPECL